MTKFNEEEFKVLASQPCDIHFSYTGNGADTNVTLNGTEPALLAGLNSIVQSISNVLEITQEDLLFRLSESIIHVNNIKKSINDKGAN